MRLKLSSYIHLYCRYNVGEAEVFTCWSFFSSTRNLSTFSDQMFRLRADIRSDDQMFPVGHPPMWDKCPRRETQEHYYSPKLVVYLQDYPWKSFQMATLDGRGDIVLREREIKHEYASLLVGVFSVQVMQRCSRRLDALSRSNWVLLLFKHWCRCVFNKPSPPDIYKARRVVLERNYKDYPPLHPFFIGFFFAVHSFMKQSQIRLNKCLPAN